MGERSREKIERETGCERDKKKGRSGRETERERGYRCGREIQQQRQRDRD